VLSTSQEDETMDFGTIATPAGATTLGSLLGPLASLAVVATLVALAVVIVGLLLERRDAVSIRRLGAARGPVVVSAGASRRRAA
jgi:hypothetical protein